MLGAVAGDSSFAEVDNKAAFGVEVGTRGVGRQSFGDCAVGKPRRKQPYSVIKHEVDQKREDQKPEDGHEDI